MTSKKAIPSDWKFYTAPNNQKYYVDNELNIYNLKTHRRVNTDEQISFLTEISKNDSDLPTWNCPSCTFENPGENSDCEMCDKVRPDLKNNKDVNNNINPKPKTTKEELSLAIDEALLNVGIDISELSDNKRQILQHFLKVTDAQPDEAIAFLTQAEWSSAEALDLFYLCNPEHASSLMDDDLGEISQVIINEESKDSKSDDFKEKINENNNNNKNSIKVQETKSNENLNDNDNYYIKRPYVIIIGISKYNHDRFKDLPAVEVDIENMYNLFKAKYGFKYVFKSLNKLEYNNKSHKIKKSKLRAYLEYHKNNINELNENNLIIDSVIFIFSGHGVKSGVLASDIKQLSFNTIRDIFSNDTIESLNGCAFLLIYDCCRASGDDKNLEGKEIELKLNKGGNDNITYVNSLSDQFIWYATSDDFVARQTSDFNGSVFCNSINKVLLDNLKNNNFNKWSLQGAIATKVNKLVLNSGKGVQMPDPQNKLQRIVYLIPQNKN